MADDELGSPIARPERDLRQIALQLLALVAVIASGILLARVLMSPDWTHAINVIGAGAVVMVLLISPRAGLLLSIFLTPFAGYLYLEFNLGRGIPDLDIARLAAAQAVIKQAKTPAVKTTFKKSVAKKVVKRK